MMGIKTIYQIFVFNPDNLKAFWRRSETLEEMFEDFIEKAENDRVIEGFFRFQKDAKGGFWIDFRPVHPDLIIAAEQIRPKGVKDKQ